MELDTYLDIDVFKIIILIVHMIHAGRIVLILEHLYALFRHIHAEARLDLDNDKDVLGCEMPASEVGALRIERCRQISFLASALLTAAVTHFRFTVFLSYYN